MNLDELVERVTDIVQDDDFDEDVIITYLNRGMLEIAGGIRRPDSSVLTQPLPLLFTIGTVATTTTFKAILPATYQRDVVFAIDSLGRELSIYDSFIEFSQTYGLMTAAGSLNAVAVKGRDLYYQNIPAVSELITIHYHRYPVDMVAGTDTPDGLPSNYHDILVDYACREIYTLEEDGIDGNNFNTMKYEKRFQRVLDALEASIAAEAAPFRFFA
jgi:hypothetical protein